MVYEVKLAIGSDNRQTLHENEFFSIELANRDGFPPAVLCYFEGSNTGAMACFQIS